MTGFSLMSTALRPEVAVPARGGLPRGAKLAVLQPLPGIGDMIWHLPHIRAIAAAAGGPVTLITKPGSAADQLLAAEPSVHRVLWLRRHARSRGGRTLLGFLAELRAARFEALVLLHHSRSLALAAALAGIPLRFGYGFGTQRLFLNRPPFLPAGALPLHPYGQASAWLAAAGIAAGAEPELPVPADAAAAVRARLGPGPRPVVLGIGSSEPQKQWGAERFAALLALLRAAGWSRPILLGGPAEAALAADIAGRGPPPAPALAIGWPLPEVAALLAQAAFYVGNDTGTANMAAAVGTRTYCLFGATPPFDHCSRIVPIVPASGVDRVHGMARIAPEAVMAAIAGESGHGLPEL
jgi:heptosyltransferase-2